MRFHLRFVDSDGQAGLVRRDNEAILNVLMVDQAPLEANVYHFHRLVIRQRGRDLDRVAGERFHQRHRQLVSVRLAPAEVEELLDLPNQASLFTIEIPDERQWGQPRRFGA